MPSRLLLDLSLDQHLPLFPESHSLLHQSTVNLGHQEGMGGGAVDRIKLDKKQMLEASGNANGHSPTQSEMVGHSCHPSPQESGTGSLQVQSQPQTHSQTQASLGHRKVCLNKQKNQISNSQAHGPSSYTQPWVGVCGVWASLGYIARSCF